MTITETAVAYKVPTSRCTYPTIACSDCMIICAACLNTSDPAPAAALPVDIDPGTQCGSCGQQSIWTTWTGSEWLTNANYPMAVYDADTAEIIPDIDLTRELLDASAKAGAEGIVLVDEDGFLVYDGANGRRVYVGVA